MADKKISELDLALLINDDAEFPFSQDNAGEPTTFKGRITQLGTKIAEDMTFSNLQTASKKLVGAINELLSLGSPIIIGTTAPTSSIGADGNIYVQYTAGTGGADDEVDGIYVKIDDAWCEISTGGGSGTTDYEDLSNKPQVNSVELVGNKSLDDLGIMPASLSKTASGSLVHITDGADNIPVKSLTSEIVAVQSGSGTPSPSNPRAISGFDNGVVSVCGINLWDEVWELGTLNTTTGANASATTRIRSKNYIPVRPNTTYTFRQGTASGQTTGRACYYDANQTFISSTSYFPSETETFNGVATFTTPNNACYMRFSPSSGYGTTYGNDISINYPSSDTDYHAYNGNTYTFTFGQTVYGGHFDNKGNLVVTHKVTTIDDLSFSYESGNTRFVTSISDLKSVGVRLTPFVTSVFYSVDDGRPIADLPDNSIYSSNTTTVYIKCLSYTDPVAFKTAFTGVKIVYPIEPITLAITSQDIPTLLGENIIFSNCGDVEVNYYTDKAGEIAEVAKATASTPLHNYSTDEHIVGTWIDGSTIYERVFDLGSDVSIANDTLTDTTIDASNMNKIIYSAGQYSTGVTLYPLMANINNNIIRLQSDRNGNVGASVRYVILQYTKSST